jgi:apolipoprotein N-acyltransferase
VIVSLLAGLLLAFSVPPWGWWPLAFVAFALLSRQLDSPSRRARAGRGALFALGWFGPAVFWMVDFTLPGYALEREGPATLDTPVGSLSGEITWGVL